MVLEKRFYINNSNTKYVSVGIKPSTKFLSPNAFGFYAEIMIGGGQMTPICVGGLDGFGTLCNAFRSIDEFKFVYPNSACDYSDVEFTPINLTKTTFKVPCYTIDIPTGRGIIAVSSIHELLKHEKMLISAFNTMNAVAPEVEKKFNELIGKCSNDFSAVVDAVEKSGDLMAIDILVNFNPLIKACIEKDNVSNATTTTSNSVASSSAATTPKKRLAPSNKPCTKSVKPPKRTKKADKAALNEINLFSGIPAMNSDQLTEIKLRSGIPEMNSDQLPSKTIDLTEGTEQSPSTTIDLFMSPEGTQSQTEADSPNSDHSYAAHNVGEEIECVEEENSAA